MHLPAATRILRRTLLACAAMLPVLALAGCSQAFFSALNRGLDGPPPLQAEFDPARSLGLDVFPPQPASHGAPVLVFFHGGTWQAGSRGDYRFVGEAMADHGILTLVPDYRKYPEVRFPGFMDDAAEAVAWARRHARAHGGDPDRIVLAGHSAGAHIAALLATDPRYLSAAGVPREAIVGLVGLAGPYDFLPTRDRDLLAIFGEEPAAQSRSQPVNFVDRHAPPALLIHGDADRLVRPANSRSLAQAYREHGVAVTHTEIPGIGHIRLLAGLRNPQLATVLGPVVEFVQALQPADATAPD